MRYTWRATHNTSVATILVSFDTENAAPPHVETSQMVVSLSGLSSLRKPLPKQSEVYMEDHASVKAFLFSFDRGDMGSADRRHRSHHLPFFLLFFFVCFSFPFFSRIFNIFSKFGNRNSEKHWASDRSFDIPAKLLDVLYLRMDVTLSSIGF